MTENRPRLALDMYVLAQGVKTGVYRVCDELYARLAASPRFRVQFAARAGQVAEVDAYLADKHLEGRAQLIGPSASSQADIVLSPFGVAPREWRDGHSVVRAHIIYDLIAISRPEYFSREAAAEVRDIVAGLDERTVIFVISECTKRDLLSHRSDLSPAQITVVPLAAGPWFKPCMDDLRKAAVRTKYAIPQRVPFVLSLATLEIRKNLDQVVRAFLLHARQQPQAETHLVLAGMSGWKLERLEAALESAGDLRHRIVLTGFIEDGDLSALYSDAMCFVYLSRYEGFGLPPLEAMACGAPVICADNSSLPEVVGEAGIMVGADDVEKVAQVIERLRSSPDEREALARSGRARAQSFNWDHSADVMADVLVAAHGRHAALPHPPRAAASGQGPGRAVEEATPLGYANGALGPVFDTQQPVPPPAVAFPGWQDAAPNPAGSVRPEGGLRTRGILKAGTTEEPLVSYVTVVRNSEATLVRTMQSVQRQTYANVEHIVVDGASTDTTLDLIVAHADGLDYFVSEADLGLYDALNKAIPLARGQIICVLNSDDWLEPHAAEIAVRRLRGQLGGAAVLATGATVYGVDGRIALEWFPEFVHPGSYFTCANVCHNGVYATRQAYEAAGLYDMSYRIAADFKWLMTCVDTRVRFVYTREITVNYSMGGTSGDALGHSLECVRIVAERFPFLSDSEVRGLYDCYFGLAHQLPQEVVGRPDSRTRFLRQLFAANNENPGFLIALGWAATVRLEHPLDVEQSVPNTVLRAPSGGSSTNRLTKELAKRALRRYPRIYGAAARSYAWMRR